MRANETGESDLRTPFEEMRFLVLSACLFISLILASTSFYFYIIVSHYFNSQAFQGHKRFVQQIIGNQEETTTNAASSFKTVAVIGRKAGTKSSNVHVFSEEVRRYKEQLVQKLHKKQLEAANVLFRPDRDQNRYKIAFKGRKAAYYASVTSLCKVSFKTIDRSFNGFEDLEILDYLPIKTLKEVVDKKIPTRDGKQRSCAMVSSAGAMIG